MPLRFTEWKHLERPSVVTHIDLADDGSAMALSLAMGDDDAPRIELYGLPGGGEPRAGYGTGGYAGRGVALAGDTLYFAVEQPGTNAVRLMRVPVAGGEPERMAEYDYDERIHSLARSPAGNFLAVLGADAEIWELEGREVIRHKQGAARDYGVHAAFSPDGRLAYIYGLVESQITVLDVVDDAIVRTLPAPAPHAGPLSVSPSGEYLYAVGWNVNGSFLYETGSGERLLPDRYSESGRTVLGAFSPDGQTLVHPSQLVEVRSGEAVRVPIARPGKAMALACAAAAPVLAFSTTEGDVFWTRFEVE